MGFGKRVKMNFLKPKSLPFCQVWNAEKFNKWKLIYVINNSLFKEKIVMEFCIKCHSWGCIDETRLLCRGCNIEREAYIIRQFKYSIEREAYIIRQFKKYFWRIK
jgi:hypothetical protein